MRSFLSLRSCLSSCLVLLFFFLTIAEAAEINVSGTILEILILPPVQTVYGHLVILDGENMVWMCKVKSGVIDLSRYKKGDKITVYGELINPEARIIEVKGLGEKEDKGYAEKETVELLPLKTLKGGIFKVEIGSQQYLILNSEDKNYILRTTFREDLLKELQEIAKNSWQAEISGIDKGEQKIITEITPRYDSGGNLLEKTAKQIVLNILDVVHINKIEKDVSPPPLGELGKTVTDPSQLQIQLTSEPVLKVVKGKVIAVNTKAVIPTLGIKHPKGQLTVILPSETNAIRLVEGTLMAVRAKDAIREGMQVEIWYEEKGDLRTAQIITILEDK